ncbi:MAG: Nramp family divalent metal transporter [Candidatus Bathyarchaeia archaeon]
MPSQSEKKEEVVHLGKIDPLKLVDFPVFPGILAMMGPGIIWASLAQGSGELIWWPYLSAKYGEAFIWWLWPACLLQYWVNLEIIRYTTLTGEGIFGGFTRFNKIFAVFLWIMLFITYLWFGGYASGGGTALAALTNFPPGWDARGQTLFWAYLTVLIFVLALTLFPVIYNGIEKFMTVVTIVCVVGLLAAIVHPMVAPYWPKYIAAAFKVQGFPANWDPKDSSTFLTAVCFAGMGGFWNVMYSYWVRDKHVGNASYIGRVTSPITGKPETIPATGVAPRDTPENHQRYKKWLRYLYVDNAIAVFVNMLTVTFTTFLGFAILHPKGLVPSGWKLVSVQAEWFGSLWGYWGYILMWIIGAAFIADSWLGACDAVSRMHADFLFSTFRKLRKLTFRQWYYIWVGILTLSTCVTMVLVQPAELLLAGGILNFISMTIYCPVLIYMNYYKIPKTIAKWTRPGVGWLIVGIIVTIVYLALSIWYLGVTFKLM